MMRLRRLAIPLPVITLLIAELVVPSVAWAAEPTGETSVSVGFPEPNQDPTRLYTNPRRRPDLLETIDNGLGTKTVIGYQPWQAPPSDPRDATRPRLPHVAWVVERTSTTTTTRKS
jgi:hypothetical protein